jgi:hypothetical protein
MMSTVSALNPKPLLQNSPYDLIENSINNYKKFIISTFGGNPKLGEITTERVRKWKIYFTFIIRPPKIMDINSKKRIDELFCLENYERNKRPDSSEQEIDKIVTDTIDEVLELSFIFMLVYFSYRRC